MGWYSKLVQKVVSTNRKGQSWDKYPEAVRKKVKQKPIKRDKRKK